MSENVIELYQKALNSRRYHQEKLEQTEQEIDQLRLKVDQKIEEIAGKFLIDEQGEPIQGGVYWFSHQAVIRINGELHLISLRTVDDKKIFPSEPAAEPPQEVTDDAV